ncbi:MAG: hypothetical protein VXY56_06025 [Pseudomonadota bacterium]|nr:hypothetical protein [Pseudomonadota bacterium]
MTKLRRMHIDPEECAETGSDAISASSMAGGGVRREVSPKTVGAVGGDGDGNGDDKVSALFGDDGDDDMAGVVPGWMGELSLSTGTRERILESVDGYRADAVMRVETTVEFSFDFGRENLTEGMSPRVRRCLQWVPYAHALLVVYDRRHPAKDLCRLLLASTSFPETPLEMPGLEQLRMEDWSPGAVWTTSDLGPEDVRMCEGRE